MTTCGEAVCDISVKPTTSMKMMVDSRCRRAIDPIRLRTLTLCWLLSTFLRMAEAESTDGRRS